MEIERIERGKKEVETNFHWFRHFFWQIHATSSEICGLVTEMIQAVVVNGDFSFNDRERKRAKEE